MLCPRSWWEINTNYFAFNSLNGIQDEYKDSDGTVIGLGFDYRESLELSVGRLASHLNLETG